MSKLQPLGCTGRRTQPTLNVGNLRTYLTKIQAQNKATLDEMAKDGSLFAIKKDNGSARKSSGVNSSASSDSEHNKSWDNHYSSIKQ